MSVTIAQPSSPPAAGAAGQRFELALDRILVVKLADIGDVLTATPALRALRARFPTAAVDVLTTPHAATVLPQRLVDRVWTAPRALVASAADGLALGRLLAQLRRRRYDAVVFLHHLTLRSGVAKYRLLAAATAAPVLAGLDNGHGGWLTHAAPDAGFGACHEVEYALRVVERLGAAAPSDLRLMAACEQADLAAAAGWLQGVAGRPRVAIHPGSGGYSLARRWEADKWAAVADGLARAQGAAIILVGTAADGVQEVVSAMATSALDVSGRTTLPQLAALLSQCDLFLGADSGVMHLAVAAGVPVLALFGPSNHLAWGPWTPGGQARVVRLGLSCSPCSYVGHSVGWRDGCWHRSCLADLQPAHVLAAVEAWGVLRADNKPAAHPSS